MWGGGGRGEQPGGGGGEATPGGGGGGVWCKECGTRARPRARREEVVGEGGGGAHRSQQYRLVKQHKHQNLIHAHKRELIMLGSEFGDSPCVCERVFLHG